MEPTPQIPTLRLADDAAMPALGLGTWKSAPGEVGAAVRHAVEVGYRHIDCAAIYGNEREIGQAIADCLRAGTVAREQLWITSKLWNDAHAPEHVRPALERTLADLQLERLDLYLMHWPVALAPGVGMPRRPEDILPPETMPLERTWEAMAKLVDAGLTRHIGVSNFSRQKLARLQAGLPQPAMNQIELHPYLQQRQLVTQCQAQGIQVTAYSPLGSADRPAGMKGQDEPILLADPTIGEIARQHEASPAQVLIAWALARGTAVIPKSTNPQRIEQNLAAAGLALTPEDLQRIESLDRHRRYVEGDMWTPPGSPYTAASLWDE
ncbi:MAG: aldo/keto reductase [Pseudomonadota bacterium]|nr:aldo/keto reductase [Pseudomonadota bacterium]